MTFWMSRPTDLKMRAWSHVSKRHLVQHVVHCAVSIEVKVDCSVVSIRDHCHTSSTWFYWQAVHQLFANGDYPRWLIRLQIVRAIKNQRHVHLTSTACSWIHSRLDVRKTRHKTWLHQHNAKFPSVRNQTHSTWHSNGECSNTAVTTVITVGTGGISR